MVRQNDKENLLLDSYQLFFEYFKIKKEDFYEFGLSKTIFTDENKALTQWEQLKENLFSNKDLHIRNFGRSDNGSKMFCELYKYLFNNEKIAVDVSNNRIPHYNLENITGHKKNKTISNFQVSHIFGHTKNPLLFEAVWNICFTPKIVDPFTGHESKGHKDYQKLFQNYAYSKYENIINDYNNFVKERGILDRIKLYVDSIKNEYGEKQSNKFYEAAKKEWEPILPL